MNKTIKNIFFNISYQILNIIIPLITAPYIARVMTPNEIGVYSYSSALAGYFAVFMLLGIANYGSRTIAMNSQKGKSELSAKFWEMYSFQIFASMIGIILFVFLSFFLNSDYKLALFAQIFYLISIALDVSWYFTGTGQFKSNVTRGFVVRILQTVLIFLLVKSSKDVLAYILIMSIGSLLGNFTLWLLAMKQISFRRVSLKSILTHIKPNLVLFIPLLASSVFVYMDKIMLGAITTNADLGLFEYAEKIVRIPLAIVSAIGAVMMPKISSLASQKNETDINKYMSMSIRYISLLACVMCFGIIAIAPEFTFFYLGEAFAFSGLLMQIMSIIILFSSFANILRTQYLIPYSKDRDYVLSIVLGAFVNLVLNAILIPLWGSVGAVIGTIGAEMFVLIGHLVATRKDLTLKRYFSQWGYSLLCGLIMFIAVKFAVSFLDSNLYKLIVGIATGGFVFIIAAATMLIIQKDELILKIFKRR